MSSSPDEDAKEITPLFPSSGVESRRASSRVACAAIEREAAAEVSVGISSDSTYKEPHLARASNDASLQSVSEVKQPENGRRAFRADLQGLRSMAAILIAMGHIWTPSASGGVGVFYFIGGFFVIGSLHRKTSTTGQMEVGKFLAHTFSRIIPEAYAAVVLIAVLVCTWLSPMDRAENLTDGITSTLFVTNWWFRYKNTDYLARDVSLSPYLLFWSLADIVQVYAMNALVYWGLTKCVPKARLDHAGIGWLLLQVVGSYFYLIYLLSTGHYETAYFETPLWVWMFAAGALTSRFANKLHVPERVSTVLTTVALLIIVTVSLCIVALGEVPKQLRFGLFCAAAMIVIAGETPTPSKLLAPIFGNRVFVHLGSNSYFIFLLHWPIVLAFMQVSGHWSSSFLRGLSILAITLVLAEACSRVFAWLRSQKLHKPSIQFMLLWIPLNLLLLRLAYSHTTSSNGGTVNIYASNNAGGGTGLHPGALAIATRVFDASPLEVAFIPRPDKAGEDFPDVYFLEQCSHGDFRKLRCAVGAIGAGTVVVMMGASHVAQWTSVMQGFATTYQWELHVHMLSKCDFYTSDVSDTCLSWLADTTAEIQRIRPTVLFVLGTQGKFQGGREGGMSDQAADFYASMRELGTSVVALRDNPRVQFDIPRCVQTNIDADYETECSPARSFYNDDVMQAIVASGIHDAFIDTRDFFCDDTTCPVVIGNMLVYRDGNHITRTYMKTLAPLLERKLRIQVPTLFSVRVPQGSMNNTTNVTRLLKEGP
jgi:peptidoglycan/LPS O-acetylase OafA/YrhL